MVAVTVVAVEPVGEEEEAVETGVMEEEALERVAAADLVGGVTALPLEAKVGLMAEAQRAAATAGAACKTIWC